MTEAGSTDVQVTVGSRRTGDPFTVLVASGTKAPGRPLAASGTASIEPTRADTNEHTPRDCSRTTHPHPRRRHGHDDPAPQAHRGGLPRRALCAITPRSQRQQRPARPDAARRHRRHPSRIPGRRRRHRRDEHVHEHRHRPGRLRARVARVRVERRGRAAGQGGGRGVDGQDARAPAIRGRIDRADEPHAVHLTGRQRSGVPRR